MNPYKTALGLAGRRLLWDINPESWRSRRKIKALQNQYKGQKAVILCNGPSLLDVDFSLLEDTFTFGLNKINLLFDKSDFRPSAIVAINSYVIDQNKHFYSDTDIPLFLDAGNAVDSKIRKNHNTIFIHTADVSSFSQNCNFSIFQGYTVTYVAMQLAYHMGFESVALVGCDHDFVEKGSANTLKVAQGEDQSHFHKDYFSNGQQWQLPDLLQSEVYYTLAREAYRNDNKEIVNATSGGELEVYPRVCLKDFLVK